MATQSPPLSFSTEFDPQTGHPVAVAPGVVRVTAPNAGPYTFTGTNTFLLGDETVAVVDPGPDDARHLSALREAIGGRRVEAILLTHTHKDHCALVARLRAETGAPLWFEGRHRLSRPRRRFEVNAIARSSDWTLVPDRALADGETVTVAGVVIAVIASPGHCANHLCFGLAGTPYVLSGDHVMGWNSTLVSVPDGSMADYFASLDRMVAAPFSHYLPAHGGEIIDGRGQALALKAHREQRNRQVIAAVTAGATTLDGLRRSIYPDLKPMLWPAAVMTLTAHIEYLEAKGELVVRRGLLRTRLALP